MATREASIRVSAKTDGFRRGIKDATSDVERNAAKMKGSLRGALSEGAKGGLDALNSGLSKLKSTIMGLGGLLGGIGIASLVKDAIQTEAAFRKLSFSIKAGGKGLVEWRDLQRDAKAVALETGQSTDDLAKAMQAIFEETGDADFARKTIGSIATAATGAHQPLETMASIAGTLNEKFAIGKDDIQSALATVVSLGNQGGVSVGELSERLGFIGAYAKTAGLEGEAGLKKIVGMLNVADNTGKNFRKNITTVGGVFEMLASAAHRTKIASALGIDPKKIKGDAISAIAAINVAAKGSAAKLEKAGFTEEQIKLLAELGKQGGGNLKEAIEAAGKSAIKYSDLQDEAAKEMQTSEKQFQVALERLKQSFMKPEITEAINKLAQFLPKLADIIASVVGFAVEHPVLAGGAAAAATFGGGALSGGLQALVGGLFTSGGTALAGSFAAALGGPVGLAIGAVIAGAVLYGMHQDAKKLEEERTNTAKTGQKILDADRQKIVGTLQAQGIPVSPLSGMSIEQARRLSPNLEAADKAEAAIRADRAGAFKLTPEQQERLLASQAGPGGFSMAPPAGPNASIQPPSTGPTAPPRFTPGKSLDEILGKELKVRVVNPKEIGAEGTSFGKPTPGNVERGG